MAMPMFDELKDLAQRRTAGSPMKALLDIQAMMHDSILRLQKSLRIWKRPSEPSESTSTRILPYGPNYPWIKCFVNLVRYREFIALKRSRIMKATGEIDRLRQLDFLYIRDTHPEERFDRYARLVSIMFNMPTVIITFGEDDRVWLKSSIGNRAQINRLKVQHR